MALAAQLFGWRIIKTEQLSNWELPELSESQISYASTDAWVSLKIYQELSKYGNLDSLFFYLDYHEPFLVFLSFISYVLLRVEIYKPFYCNCPK